MAGGGNPTKPSSIFDGEGGGGVCGEKIGLGDNDAGIGSMDS